MNKVTNLPAKYPKILAECDISCGDGWYQILDTLCEQIQHEIDNPDWVPNAGPLTMAYYKIANKTITPIYFKLFLHQNHFYKGYRWRIWNWLCHRLLPNIKYAKPEKGIPQVVAKQIKEKFGGLRFYYEGGNDKIKGMVDYASALSYHTCEECGAPNATQSTVGWIKTLCKRHHTLRNKKLKKSSK
jgi:hypothetical protein